MNNENEKAKAAIDALLEGKSDAFKVIVLELSRQLSWDDDDPAFLIAIATHQLEALVQQYPSEIAAVMETASKKLAADWQQIQAKLIVSAMESTKTAHEIDNRLNEARALLNDEFTRVKQLLRQQQSGITQAAAAEQEKIKTQAGSQAELLTTVYQEQRKQLKSEAEQLAAVAIAHAQATAAGQVKDISKGLRKAYYLEAAGFACACAAALILTSWTMAWVSRGRAENNSVWGDIERWNGDELQACVNAKTPTCNFHIKMPKEK